MEIYHGTNAIGVDYQVRDGATVLLVSGLNTSSVVVRIDSALLKIPATGYDAVVCSAGDPSAATQVPVVVRPDGILEIAAPRIEAAVGFLTWVEGSGAFKTFVLLQMKDAMLRATALRVDADSSTYWLLFLRPSSTRLSFRPSTGRLAVEHGNSTAEAELIPTDGGALKIDTRVQGYRKVELFVTRTLGGLTKVESIGDAKDGSGSFVWKPQRHEFDVMAVFRDTPPKTRVFSSMTSDVARTSDALELFKALGAKEPQSNLLGLDIQRENFYCDGPGMEYEFVMKADRIVSSETAMVKLIASD